MKRIKPLVILVLLTNLSSLASVTAQTLPTTVAPKDSSQPFIGSLPLPPDTHRETDEALAYQSLTEVSLAQAVEAARTMLNVGNDLTSAQLDNESGFLIWEVTAGNQVVKVDAGNARILQIEQLSENEANDDNELTYQSSGSDAEQPSEPNGKKGGGETPD